MPAVEQLEDRRTVKPSAARRLQLMPKIRVHPSEIAPITIRGAMGGGALK